MIIIPPMINEAPYSGRLAGLEVVMNPLKD